MGDVTGAFKLAILTYILGLLTCGLIGVIILIVRKLTSNREKEIG
jgi:hypothetical protein